MTDPFSLATGIGGLVSLAIQLVDISYWYVTNVQGSSESWKAIIKESKSLRNLLMDLKDNLLDDKGLAEAFDNRASSVLTRLGAPKSSITPSFAAMTINLSSIPVGSGPVAPQSESIVDMCSKDLETFIRKVEKKSEGNALKRGLYKLASAFTEDDIQSTLEMLHRYQTMFNASIAIDTLTLTAATHNIVKETHHDTLYLRTREEEEERDAILGWLSPLNFEAEHKDVFAKYKEGTGEWLLASREFGDWRSGQGETLWCKGSLMLNSRIIEYLRHQFSAAPAVGIAGIYCNYTKAAVGTQDLPILLGSVCAQLINSKRQLPKTMTDLYAGRAKGCSPRIAELREILQSQTSTFMKIFIIVDGLDEYPENNQSELIAELRELQLLANLLVTSRDLGNIEMLFEGDPKLRIIPLNEDLYLYVQDRMTSISKDVIFKRRVLNKDPSLQESIPKIVIEKAAGMFLLAQLHMNEVSSKSTPGAVRKALGSLPPDINATYDQAMERIGGLPVEDRTIALKTLSWIHMTSKLKSQDPYQRPKLLVGHLNPQHLSVLRLGVSIRAEEETFDEEFVPDREDITSFCAGLVVIDELRIVKFVHFSAEEYFDTVNSTLGTLSPPTNFAIDCIAFIKQYCRANGPLLNDPADDDGKPIYGMYPFKPIFRPRPLRDKHRHQLKHIVKSNQGPLATYMLQTWGQHVLRVTETNEYAHYYSQSVWHDLNETQTEVRSAFIAALQEPAVFRHWRTLSRYPAPTIWSSRKQSRYKYSGCWKEPGITSLLIALGLEAEWAAQYLLDQNEDIKATFLVPYGDNESSLATSMLEAEVEGKLLLAISIPRSIRQSAKIWSSR